MTGSRVSSNITRWDVQSSLMEKGVKRNDAYNKNAAQSRIQSISDDPVSVAMAMKYESQHQRLGQFSKNINTLRARHSEVESEMSNILNVMHSVRELAIKGANSPTAAGAMKELSVEADGLLNQIVRFANHVDENGNAIFAGNSAIDQAFRVMEANVPGADSHKIIGVQYLGDKGLQSTEIADRQYLNSAFNGSDLFWSENSQIASERDASAYRVETDSKIFLDGHEINLKAGDSIYSIAEKINGSGIAVEASTDPVTNGLVLTSRTPHKIWAEDGQDSNVLSDLGIVDSMKKPPYNVSGSSQQTGGSIFDAVIFLRDQFLQGDIEAIGGRGIELLDKAIDSLTSGLTEVGTRDKVAEVAQLKLGYDADRAVKNISDETGLDLAKGITDLQAINDAYNTSIKSAGKLLQPSLLDYLR